MSTAPALIDRDALDRHRTRATESFLHRLARAEVDDRLAMVNRRLSTPAVVTPDPQSWSGFAQNAQAVADTEVLDLLPGRHDLVVHAMALHWANDPVGQLIQCRHALTADGLLLAVCLGGQTLHELRTALAAAESDVSGGLSPRVVPMAEIRDLGALLQRAGFALPVADSQRLTVQYQSPLHLMRDLRAMGETNALSARLRHPTRRGVLMRACEIYQQTYGDTDGHIPATFEVITLTGWAPSPDQPQPLRPGSAAQRLADALGTRETPLKD